MRPPSAPSRGVVSSTLTFAASLAVASSAYAGGMFGQPAGQITGGSRWDAAPRSVSGFERSLAGGLRFSLQGGSYQSYRDLFTWNAVPSVADFTTAVNQAFSAWTGVDPISGLGSTLSFAYDPSTAPVGVAGGGINIAGAEIDLFGAIDAGFWNPGNSGTQGETAFDAVNGPVKLTSGTLGYAGFAISGADIIMNSNPQAVYSLDLFRRILTHEIGHAIGLADVEGSLNPGKFMDDNYNPSNPLATLTNNWALLVDPLNPGASAGISRFTITDAAFTTAGVNILMESFGVGIAAGNPVTNLVPLSNDDFSTRQFLYPVVPEPAAVALSVVGLLLAARRAKRS